MGSGTAIITSVVLSHTGRVLTLSHHIPIAWPCHRRRRGDEGYANRCGNRSANAGSHRGAHNVGDRLSARKGMKQTATDPPLVVLRRGSAQAPIRRSSLPPPRIERDGGHRGPLGYMSCVAFVAVPVCRHSPASLIFWGSWRHMME